MCVCVCLCVISCDGALNSLRVVECDGACLCIASHVLMCVRVAATLLAHCLRMLKAAFEDVAVASHAVLAGICHHSWGRTVSCALHGAPAVLHSLTPSLLRSFTPSLPHSNTPSPTLVVVVFCCQYHFCQLLDTQPSFFEVVSDRTSTYGYEVAKLKYKIAQVG